MKTEYALRPFWPGDGQIIAGRRETAHERAAQFSWVSDASEFAKAEHKAMTLTLNDRPVAAAGLIHCWHGYAQAWGVFADLPPRAAFPIVRACRQAISAAVEDWSLYRIEAFCPAGFAIGERMLLACGFQKLPVTLRKRMNGQDETLWEIVKGDK